MEFPYQGSGLDLTLGLSERIRIPDSSSISVIAAMDPLDESIGESVRDVGKDRRSLNIR